MSFGFFVSETKASNPTNYPSFHQDLGRAGAPDKDGLFDFPGKSTSGYLPYFRVFIPPGTTSLYLAIYEYGHQTAIARYKIPPTTNIIPPDYFNASSRTLNQLTASDQIISENNEGKLTIINQGLYPAVPLDEAGWLYANVTGGKSSSVYNTTFLIRVDAKIYNDWYDSINWARDVEDVKTYTAPILPFLPGDLNQDGTVNLFDYNLFLLEFGKTSTNNIADLNQDGKVDIFDYNIFLGNFGKSG